MALFLYFMTQFLLSFLILFFLHFGFLILALLLSDLEVKQIGVGTSMYQINEIINLLLLCHTAVLR